MAKVRLPSERKVLLEAGRSVEGRVVTGFPSIFGNVDDGGDVVQPGAFRKTLSEQAGRLRWLWQHHYEEPPIAKVLEAREVGREELPADVLARFPEATGGLLVKREYLETPRADEVLAGIVAGATNEMSFGYDTIDVKYPKDLVIGGKKVRRELRELRLFEFSDVNWGMNPATTNLKDLLAGIEAVELQQKALAQWLESRLHLTFTEIADDLYGNGHVTREERIALSGLISDALNAFNAGMEAEVLAGVRGRDRWDEAPSAPLGSAQDAPAQVASATAVASAELMRARLAVLREKINLVGA